MEGGVGTTPSAVSKRGFVELSGKIGYYSRRELAIAHITFDHRSIFDLVLAGQRSYFGKMGTFSTLRACRVIEFLDQFGAF